MRKTCSSIWNLFCIVVCVCSITIQAASVNSDRKVHEHDERHERSQYIFGTHPGTKSDGGDVRSNVPALNGNLRGSPGSSSSDQVIEQLSWIQGRESLLQRVQHHRLRKRRSAQQIPAQVVSANDVQASAANLTTPHASSKTNLTSPRGGDSAFVQDLVDSSSEPKRKPVQNAGNMNDLDMNHAQLKENKTGGNSVQHSNMLNRTSLNTTDTRQSDQALDNPNTKSSNQSLPVFYRNRSQDVTSATVCVSAILVLMFGIILYSRMWRRRDQWLSLSVTLGESQEPQTNPITPSSFSIKDVIEGKMKLIQAQFRSLQKRQSNGVHKVQKNGHYERVPVRADSGDKTDSEDDVYIR